MPDKDKKAMEPESEKRILNVAELRVVDPLPSVGETARITGYAAVFNKRSAAMGYPPFVEIIRPGAFRDVLASKPDVKALLNHEYAPVFGRTTSGTLRLREDGTGLAIEIDPPDTQAARDLMASIQRGDIDQMSFAFRVGKEKWTFSEGTGDDKESDLREIEQVSALYDVSVVTFPAYPDTSANVDVRVALRHRDAALPPRRGTPNRDHAQIALARQKAAQRP